MSKPKEVQWAKKAAETVWKRFEMFKHWEKPELTEIILSAINAATASLRAEQADFTMREHEVCSEIDRLRAALAEKESENASLLARLQKAEETIERFRGTLSRG